MIHITKDKIGKGKSNGIGGKIENGESIIEALKREVYEETGLKIKNAKLRGILNFPKFKDGEWWRVYVFTSKDFNGNIKRKCNEGTLEWVPTNKLLNLNLWEDDKYFIPLLEEDNFFVATFYYKNGKIINHKIILY
ncbi:MAG: 8-oxo-dGTP diphosphatase [Nanoarchaeota archaeon]|nr:8-oxo-dGTP diphosphatase [Nanoarchaeota archaeon]